MERSKVIFWILLAVASALIVYWVGIRPPVESPARAQADPNSVAEANEPAEAGESAPAADANGPVAPAEVNEPGEPEESEQPAEVNAPTVEPNEPNEPNEPAEPLEAVNLKEVEMKNVMEKLARWTGKTIIPSDEAMRQKITIYAPDRLPRTKALQMIYSALRLKGIIAEEMDGTIFLKPIEGAKLGQVPTIPADQPLATIENKEQIVQKFFELKNYSPTEMASVIQPLIGEHGHVNADENTRSLLVIDTVANLMRLEHIINQFDIPEAEQTVTEIFPIRYGDPSEIVQMLNILLGESGVRSRSSSSDRDRSGYRPPYFGGGRYYGPRPNPEPPKQPSVSKKSSSTTGTASTVIVGTVEGPVILIPEPRRKWIIARARPQVMEQIRIWIERLDKEEPVESDYEIVNLKYADPREVEDSIEDGFRDLPGTQFLPSVLIEPLVQTRSVIVFGRKDLREIVKKMIQEVDVPPGLYETRDFHLKYADPDQVKSMIEELFGQSSRSSVGSRYMYIYNYGSRGGGSSSQSDEVKVISYPTLKQVTVIAAPEKMAEIAAQIEVWDKPLDVEAVKPRIIELKNSDPVEMAELLNTLFSERTTGRTSILDLLYGYGSGERSKIVGPLFGQLTFEDVPGTKKIIVISKIPEAYDVVEQLVLDLDREEMGEIPEVITLKYADPEDLSERLNAMFVEAGQQARIRLTATGLSDTSAMEETSSGGSSNSSSSAGGGTADTYTPPWSGSGARGRLDESMPISNVIGRVRFVPDPHTKSIMVLAPPEFMDEIRQLISQLDVPGKQVIIEAIIVSIEHSKVTSLGVELATNPAAFGSLDENAITVLTNITNVATHGGAAGRVSSGAGTNNATGSGTIIAEGTDIYALIDFLIKTTDAKILNQQTLWTKDNEEASFFKGSEVAFIGSSSITQNATTQNIEFERVGMELRARPSITPEDNVDMIVNVQLSQLTSDLVNNQPVRDKMLTTTNMIVQDGQTLLLGGILFQKDSTIRRKLPGLGDIPGIGGLFSHKEVIRSNTELLVFMTPRVVDETLENVSEATRAAIERPREKLKNFLSDLDTALEGLEGKDQ